MNSEYIQVTSNGWGIGEVSSRSFDLWNSMRSRSRWSVELWRMFKTGATFILDDLVRCTFFIFLVRQEHWSCCSKQEGNTQLSPNHSLLVVISFVFFCTCIFVRTNGHVNTKRGGSTQLSLDQFFSLVLSFYVSTKSLLQSPKFSLNISFKIQLQNLDQPSPGSNNQCHRPSQQWVTTLISQSHISQVLAHSFAIFPCSLVFEIIY